MFKIDQLLRFAAAICVVLMFWAPFAAAYAAAWLDLAASIHAGRPTMCLVLECHPSSFVAQKENM